jgi:hypothetical protein
MLYKFDKGSQKRTSLFAILYPQSRLIIKDKVHHSLHSLEVARNRATQLLVNPVSRRSALKIDKNNISFGPTRTLFV